MAIDPSAVGLSGGPVERSWTSKDCLLYAVGVGAGLDELQFATEKNQQVLPTFAVIVGGGGSPLNQVGEFNMAMLVHGEQGIELFKPIPVDGAVRSTGKIDAIWDKGSGAVVETSSDSSDAATGELLFKTTSSMFIRGAGGFGGERGPATEKFAFDRQPDHQVEYATRPDQALTYRLSGDRNPLHSDPEFAKLGGFDTPILHGLCTYGFTGRALLHTLCDSNPARFKSMTGRFSRPVIPGDVLTISMWVEGNSAKFQTHTQEGDVVLDQGRFTFEA
ncbi:MAG: MaoC/PaaZ C-terminal domain-containing protein [Pseudomonadales bacterium]|jgi:acyl dehydratase|nr:MaoC/PaaZ C-terminal domain-containing protein [Pseudomonadales bacterium]MDP7359307.1 MaoC/PaaZ C-terminal domain-containing protein [Pseudomonadales bacterium]MDP7594721.1 MaoC/PaaZ C-terminal domain-containing protein [Pseudomonadales bacterium]HJN48966.1 MaoC/PaaZ C-terminal domain-containing protein [Pseudomonadales bacterium]|tara:strand:- start:1475 stop:2302 length:828 start_codon:yes stop_codon:yes gene_type:complete